MNLPLVVKAKWRGRYDSEGKWVTEWPPLLCPECGATFMDARRRYCSPECAKKVGSRSNRHAGRTRRSSRKAGRDYGRYDVIGKYELLEAYQGLCGVCGQPLALSEVRVGHIVAVTEGGQHTRRNVAPVHQLCEEQFTRSISAPQSQ